jgi:hypothetical protein
MVYAATWMYFEDITLSKLNQLQKRNNVWFFFFFFLVAKGIGDWTLGLTLAGQELYNPTLFAFSLFIS